MHLLCSQIAQYVIFLNFGAVLVLEFRLGDPSVYFGAALILLNISIVVIVLMLGYFRYKSEIFENQERLAARANKIEYACRFDLVKYASRAC